MFVWTRELAQEFDLADAANNIISRHPPPHLSINLLAQSFSSKSDLKQSPLIKYLLH